MLEMLNDWNCWDVEFDDKESSVLHLTKLLKSDLQIEQLAACDGLNNTMVLIRPDMSFDRYNLQHSRYTTF